MPRFRTRANENGFTLIELLATLALFVLLMAIAIPIFLNQSRATAASSVRQDVHSLATNVKVAMQGNPNATGFTIYTSTNPPAAIPAGNVPVRNTSQSGNQFKIIGPVLCKDNPMNVTSVGSSAGYSVVGYSSKISGYYYWYNSITGEYYSSDDQAPTQSGCPNVDRSFNSK